MRAWAKISAILFILSLLLLFTVLYIEVIYPLRTSSPFGSITRVAGPPITYISIQLPQILENRDFVLTPDSSWSLQSNGNLVTLSGNQLVEGQSLGLHIDVEGFIPAGSYPVIFTTIDVEGQTSTSSTSWVVEVNYLLQIYNYFLNLRPVLEPLLYILTPFFGAATLIGIFLPKKDPFAGLLGSSLVITKDFSDDCKKARIKAQDAFNKWKDTLKTQSEARRELKKANEKLKESQEKLTKSKEIQERANKEWDDHISKIRANPNFGIKDVKVDFLPSSEITSEIAEGKNIVGPIRVRGEKDYVLLGPMSGDENSEKWSKLAQKVMEEAEGLKGDGVSAGEKVKECEEEVENAEKGVNDAKKTFDEADKSKQDARNNFESLLKDVKVSCGVQRKTGKLDGCDFEVFPGVLPEDEKNVSDVLKDLGKKEVKGLRGVMLTDKVGREVEYTDPNSKKVVKTRAAGSYSSATKTITGYVGDYEKRIIKHEVGHHVFKARLDDLAKEEWIGFWKKNDNKLMAPKGKMPTKYAGSDAEEGFSEVYEHYYDSPKSLDKEAKDLMEKILGGISDTNKN